MKKVLKIYGGILRLVRLLPADTRPYYAKYARENFVNYREVDQSETSLDELFQRAYNHSLWVLKKKERKKEKRKQQLLRNETSASSKSKLQFSRASLLPRT
ncbi:LYR motif-containing protein At3g19508 [Eutrema salsugineum]|uniref:LYR motif-containing protein At3g19508 n=1 Tax=Eutrema salsugineum TaxID=72664 RepID=UPI000CED1F9D|nr:LYR motif-containing protein At3g19508 [Eutrema salsugineum]